ncbi:MAG: type IV pilin N-terminal domain-containing protein [Candidatus Kariarchaeaceae archaeon]
MITKRRKAVSPVVATVLIIALVLTTAGVVTALVYYYMNQDDQPLLTVTNVNLVFDYNVDGKIDAMEIQVSNNPGKPDSVVETIEIDTNGEKYNWVTAPGWNRTIVGGREQAIRITAQSIDAQVESETEYSITLITATGYIMSTSTFSGATSLLQSDPVVVTVTSKGLPVEGALITFDLYYKGGDGSSTWIPANFWTPESTNAEGKVEADLFLGLYAVRAYVGGSPTDAVIFNRELETNIEIILGGGSVAVRVVDGSDQGMEDIYLFAADSNFVDIGASGQTNETGYFEFALGDGYYRFRASYLGDDYWSNEVSVPEESSVTIKIASGDLEILVTAGGEPVPDRSLIRLYTDDNVSMGRYDRTNITGYAVFTNVANGLYRIRWDISPDYQWSRIFSTAESPLQINFAGGEMTILVTAGGEPLPNRVLTRLYTADNVSAGRYDYLNASGVAEYGIRPAGNYRLRIDWLGQYYWTPAFIHEDSALKTLDIGGGRLTILVTAGGEPLPNRVLTRLYNVDNSSAGRYDYLNATGFAEYGVIMEGTYRLRIDWLGQYIYTDSFAHSDSSTKYVDIDGGRLVILVTAGGEPLPNRVLTRLYNVDNSSAGRYDYLNATGFAEYGVILEGTYRLRIDWLGQYVFTDVFVHANSTFKTVDIGGGRLTILVQAGGEPLPNRVLTRLYNPDNSSAGRYDYLNATGFAEYGVILEGTYRLRIDWLGQYVFTTTFDHTDSTSKTVDIGGGRLTILVQASDEALPNRVLTRLYNPDNSSAGRYDYLNATGFAEYGVILEGTYRLRIDWLGQYIFTETFDHVDSSLKEVDIGGGRLTILVQAGGEALPNRVLTRLYNPNNSSAGRYDYLNSTGFAEYGVILNGTFRLRIDWLGSYYWTQTFDHADSTLKTLNLAGGKLNILVTAGDEPLRNGVLTRLYRENNVSCGRYDYLNSTGHAEYGTILGDTFRIRVDWLGQYFMSTPFDHTDGSMVTVDFSGGSLNARILDDGADLGLNTYAWLYTSSDVYCGIWDRTNGTSVAEFGAIIGSSYKIRVQITGVYHWTSVFDYVDSSIITLELDGGSLLLTIAMSPELPQFGFTPIMAVKVH